MENIDLALNEAEKVVKRQRACACRTDDCLDKLIQEVTEARKQISAPGANVNAMMRGLNENVNKRDIVKDIADNTKELHGAVNKLGKVDGLNSQLRAQQSPSLIHVINLRCKERSVKARDIREPESPYFPYRLWTKPLFRTSAQPFVQSSLTKAS